MLLKGVESGRGRRREEEGKNWNDRQMMEEGGLLKEKRRRRRRGRSLGDGVFALVSGDLLMTKPIRILCLTRPQ